MSELAPSAMARLREVYLRYDRAQLGELNTTAEELREVARQLGWSNATQGLRPWVRGKLGLI